MSAHFNLASNRERPERNSIEIFTTCQQSKNVDKSSYLRNVADVARWSEDAGCKGILVYTDNSIVDPWLVGQLIIQSTERLSPLVAIQPVYMHLYSVAKTISTYGFLHNRRICLNMVADGCGNLAAVGDRTPHDRRYERLVKYTLIIKQLLAGGGPVSFAGAFYQTESLRLAPELPCELFPGIFVSSSSEAGLAAARAIGASTGDKWLRFGLAQTVFRYYSGIGNGVRRANFQRSESILAGAVSERQYKLPILGRQLRVCIAGACKIYRRRLSDFHPGDSAQTGRVGAHQRGFKQN